MAGRGKWSKGELYLKKKKKETEEIVIYTNRKDPVKFDTEDEEENYWNGIIGWMRLNRSSAQMIGLR